MTTIADASTKCAPMNTQSWLQQPKRRLKHNQVLTVITSLKPHLEPENLPDERAPVRACYRYLINRPGQFNYQDALQNDLLLVKPGYFSGKCFMKHKDWVDLINRKLRLGYISAIKSEIGPRNDKNIMASISSRLARSLASYADAGSLVKVKIIK